MLRLLVRPMLIKIGFEYAMSKGFSTLWSIFLQQNIEQSSSRCHLRLYWCDKGANDGGVSDSSEGSVSLPSDGSGCYFGDSLSVTTGNDDALRMTCPSSAEGDMDDINMPAMQCMCRCYV
ncbi:hypothetical protein L1987_48846 [Smallanthus sonchifolius]|uniref:Uncharacterized protein n=1 Tax=Smallanthus sonchifolius TaxID=185202 RepID=A0ACB9FUR2_9ASTR|nr:hypothetical protein L1987_48846 [Smallanthus sonchifolius]